MSAENPIQLVVDEDSQVLSAIYQPDGDNPEPPTRQALEAAVQAQEWGLEVLDEDLVAARCVVLALEEVVEANFIKSRR